MHEVRGQKAKQLPPFRERQDQLAQQRLVWVSPIPTLRPNPLNPA